MPEGLRNIYRAPDTGLTGIKGEISQQNYIDFLFELYSQDIPLNATQLQLLKDNNLIDIDSILNKTKFTGQKSIEEIDKDELLKDRLPEKRNTYDSEDKLRIPEDVLETDVKKRKKVIDLNKAEVCVAKSDWMPNSIVDHSKGFVDWINSINSGFQNRIRYDRFELYKLQDEQWRSDKFTIEDIDDEELRYEYMMREFERCSINTLYAANKYYWLKDEKSDMGKTKYYAHDIYEHQKVCFYLFDCGYSIIIGKPRQPGITSTFGIAGMNRCLHRKNYFLKFIAEDKSTSEEIFEDKIKFSFYSLEGWFQPQTDGKPDVVNDRDGLFKIGRRGHKGKVFGANSKIQVTPPYKTAINGGTPPLVFVDEIGSISILTEMINEGRPTMFRRDPVTGDFEIVGQLVMWGCVCAGTKVWTNNGDFINIEDLKQEQGILGYNGVGISQEDIPYYQEPYEKQCYRITTHTGRYLECSYDHPILWSTAKYCITPKKRKRKFYKKTAFIDACRIKEGDQIAIIEEVPIFGNKQMWEPRLIGWLIGDGSYRGKKTPVISNCDEEITGYIEANFDYSIEATHITKTGKLYKEIRIRSISDKLRQIGLRYKEKGGKKLPIDIHSYVKDDICKMLGGIFDTDGCVHYTGENYYIDLTSFSYALVDEIRFVLQKLGIHCNISRIRANRTLYSRDRNDWYELKICDTRSVNAFYNNISFAIKYKQERLEEIVEKFKDRGERIAHNIKGLRFEIVKEIIPIGNKKVYNLMAGRTHTYIANGIVTHNTGTLGKGGGSFENEWKRIGGLWNEKEFTVGIIPLFLDWSTRCDKKEYESQKRYYYGSRAQEIGIDEETSRVQFHQHYPTTPDDMFATTQKTLIGREKCDVEIKKINNLDPILRPTHGYLVPIFDKTKPMPEGQDIPYKIVGADFVPTQEYAEQATTIIFQRPKARWINRYFQGTDPISSDTGMAKMSSSIWDKYYKTISALVNFRKTNDPNYSFLQCMLLGLYYDPVYNLGVPELIEKNIGLAYKNYKQERGVYRNLMYNAELPDYLRGPSDSEMGIDNKGNRAKAIINKMHELFTNFGDRIYISIYFEQLKTFICKITRSGNETWESVDKRYYFDDTLFSAVYAYIAGESYVYKIPKNMDAEIKNQKVMYINDYDRDYNMVRRPIRLNQ